MINLQNLHITKSTPKEAILKLATVEEIDWNGCLFSSGCFVDEDLTEAAKHFKMTEDKFKKEYLEPLMLFGTTLHRPKLLRKEGKPHGRCVFYNDHEKCTLQGLKPFQCKIGTHNRHGEQISQWFTLNYFVNPEDPLSLREWAAHLKIHPTIPGGELHELTKR